MRAKMRLFAVICILVLGLGGRAEAQAHPTEAYPIWWSPSLGIEGLDDVEKRLEDPAWFGGGIPIYKGEGVKRNEAIADSCESLNRLLREGYYARITHSSRVVRYHSAKCRAMRMLLDAKPAKTSFVRNFTLDAHSLSHLPAMVYPTSGCDFLCRQFVANERRISWNRFAVSKTISTESVSEHELKVLTETKSLTLKLMARADFTGDGLEDLLLWVNVGATEGTWGTTRNYLLTRDTPNGVLWVLDADKYLCSPDTYHPCRTDYDYPEALRRTD